MVGLLYDRMNSSLTMVYCQGRFFIARFFLAQRKSIFDAERDEDDRKFFGDTEKGGAL